MFLTAISVLRRVQDYATCIAPAQDSLSPQHFELRLLNDELFKLLSATQQERVYQRVEIRLLSTSQSKRTIPSWEEWPAYLQIGYREVTEQMRLFSMESLGGPSKDMKLSRDALRDWEPFQACIKAKFFQGQGLPDISVLIEWIVYDVHWTGEVGKDLFRRIGALAEMLNEVSTSGLFRTLSCRGYFHAPDRRAFGLVYEIPVQSDADVSDTPNLISLHQLIKTIKDVRQRPPLEDIFAFTQGLAKALLEFHKVGWLHKSLTSYNVVCIQTKDQQDLLGCFRIVGFNFSRLNHPNEYTEGPWTQTKESRLYQHPTYLRTRCRYRPEYDYYSFGLVLLEIGLWKCLATMFPQSSQDEGLGQEKDNEGLTEHLLEKWVLLLGPRMGSRYRDVVHNCLKTDKYREGSSSTIGPFEDPSAADIELSFERHVVEELRVCKV